MNNYQKKKADLRAEAMEWQTLTSDLAISWGSLAYCSNYFEKQGRKYGLIKEFRENGII